MSEEREPDHSEDPREQSTGQGYPESGAAGSTPKEGTESGPGAGTGGAQAPDGSSPKDGDAGQATGNPDAAG